MATPIHIIFFLLACLFGILFMIFVYYLYNEKLTINEVNVYCGSYLPDWRGNVNFRKIYSAKKNMGGGVHLDLIHEIDYSTWLFGQPMETYGFMTSTSSLNIDSTDYAQYNLMYEKFVLNIKLNYFRRDTKREIEIVLEDDILVCDLLNSEIRNSKNEIIFVDNFENVIININKDDFEEQRKGRSFKIVFKRDEVIDRISESYADVNEGEKLALFNSANYLEIAINKGNAAGLLGLQGFSEKQVQSNRLFYQTVKVFFE